MFDLKSLDQIVALANNGETRTIILSENEELLAEMRRFQELHGGAPKGKVKLEIEYVLDLKQAVTIKVTHKIEYPKQPPGKGVAWMSPSGGLTTDNPNQSVFDLRPAPDADDDEVDERIW